MVTGIYYRAVCIRSMVAINFKLRTVDELLLLCSHCRVTEARKHLWVYWTSMALRSLKQIGILI